MTAVPLIVDCTGEQGNFLATDKAESGAEVDLNVLNVSIPYLVDKVVLPANGCLKLKFVGVLTLLLCFQKTQVK